MPWTAALAGDLSIILDTLWSAGVALTQSVRRVHSRDRIEVNVAEGADAIALAAPAWRAVQDRGGAATPFQTLAIAEQTAQAHLRRGESPRISIVYEDGQPTVLFPTVIARWSGVPAIRFLGDPLIQYGDLVAAPDASPAAVEAAWRAAADASLAKIIVLRKVRADARIAPLLAHTTEIVAEQHAPYIDAGVATALCARDLRELRRFRRRLADIGEVRFDVLRGFAAHAAVREALDIKREWLTARGLSSSVIGDPDWEQVLTALSGDSRGDNPLRAALLTVDCKTAAVEIGLVQEQRWCAFLGAVAPDFVKAGPGHVQMADTVAHCRTGGIATYDLLAPADPYKHAVARDAVAVRDHAAALAGGGWLAVLATRAVPTLKGMASRMPPRLRQALRAWYG